MSTGDARFSVLGPLVLQRDGIRVFIPRGHQRTLLALLLWARGTPISRDRLIDELWGERPPASAVSALHVHLSKLRGALGELLVLTSAGYRLAVDRYELDLDAFESLLTRATAVASQRPETAAELVQAALALIQGEPLSDVSGGATVAVWRSVLSDRMVAALSLRIDLDISRGRASEVVGELEQLVTKHPFDERLWRALIEALYRDGRQAAALDAFERVRMLLASELGLAPGPALTGLQQRILAHDPQLGPAKQPGAQFAPTDGPRPPTSRTSSLPTPPTVILGRETELAELMSLLSHRGDRLITLTGTGGVGKTRLMLELAHAAESRYADGAVWVELDRLRDPDLVVAEIAHALTRRLRADAVSPDRVTEYLKDRELLLALDNFEHLLPAARSVAELLRDAPAISVVVSSRAPLRLRAEHTFPVAPLSLTGAAADGPEEPGPAVRMLLARAREPEQRSRLSAAKLNAATAICRAVDGLPLAIELAGARATLVGLEPVAATLAKPLTVGAGALRDLPDRQQTLEAAIDWSYQLLSGDAQELLQAASSFPAGFTAPALAAVVDHPVRDGLFELQEASLVHRSAAPDRYHMLALVQAFAAERLAVNDRATEFAARQDRYFVAAVAAGSAEFDSGVSPGAIAAGLIDDDANLRLVFDRSLRAGDRGTATTLALGLRPLWVAGSRRQEGSDAIERLLAGPELPADAELRLLRVASFLEGFKSGERTWSRRLVSRAGTLGDPAAYSIGINNLFNRALEMRDRDEIARLRPTMLEWLTQTTDAQARGWTLHCLSIGAYIDGCFEQAQSYAEQAAEQAKLAEHDYMRAGAAAMGLFAASAAQHVIRQPQLASALALIERADLASTTVFGLWMVACYAAALRDPSAVRWLTDAEQIRLATDMQLWPEQVLQREALAALGLREVPASAATDSLTSAPVAAAIAWLADRDPSETAPRIPFELD